MIEDTNKALSAQRLLESQGIPLIFETASKTNTLTLFFFWKDLTYQSKGATVTECKNKILTVMYYDLVQDHKNGKVAGTGTEY